MRCQRLRAVALLAGLRALNVCGADDILRSDAAREAARPRFSAADEEFLERVERACFEYFWREVGEPSKLVKDRFKGPVSSIAAVGFQLAALPIGVERGWIEREAGRQRAATVLKSLIDRTDNRKFGVYLHFPDLSSGGLSREGYEMTASTVDHALLLAGALAAASYFERDVAELTERMVRETNWKAYAVAEGGLLSMGWRPEDPERLDGPGRFIEYSWHDASDEERLIYFLAVGSPNDAHALPPESYYRLKRVVKRHGDLPPFVVSWPGALFTYFFSHCYIDYRSLSADDPAAFGVEGPRVDWFENSRRAVLTQRARTAGSRACPRTLGEHAWGLSACDGPEGYLVPEVTPNLSGKDDWGGCTIAPYAAGAAIMFAPRESLEALRAFHALRGDDGRPLVWRDAEQGGYGFADAFCLTREPPFVSGDYIGIDQGPMLLGIENARTGLIWKLFMRHDVARRAVERLKLH